jgi:hypothetical protein
MDRVCTALLDVKRERAGPTALQSCRYCDNVPLARSLIDLKLALQRFAKLFSIDSFV